MAKRAFPPVRGGRTPFPKGKPFPKAPKPKAVTFIGGRGVMVPNWAGILASMGRSGI